MMREHDLHELAELVSSSGPILSLYLSMDPHRGASEEHKLALRQLLAQAAEKGAASADIERIERFFGHEYDRQGRGVVCFACQALDFWRTYSLLVPVEDAMYVGQRPYLTPLSDLWDGYGRFGVITVDSEGARAFVYHLGALEDSAGTLGETVKRHKQGGWGAQKLQRHEDQEARHNLKEAAEWADDYLRQHKVTRVVLSGSDANLAQLHEVLPRSLQENVIGQVNLHMNATPAQVWERAYEVAIAAQRQAEADLVAEVITAARKGGAGALGLADTLSALQQGRIYRLLVTRDFRQPGYRCSNCGAVLVGPLDKCPYCEGSLVTSADVVNLAVQRVLDQGLPISVVDGTNELANLGGIAAVLRY
jgi:peptide subunit release factor 1 (eRF1)